MRHLLTFFLLAYAISWVIWMPLWLPAFGVHGLPVLPYHHALGAAGPVVAAFLVAAMESGKDGPRRLLAGLLPTTAAWPYLLVALLAPFAVVVAAAFGASLIGGQPFSLTGLGTSREFPQFSALGFIAYNLVTFGLGEEIGWRGFALPRLQTRFSALTASILLTLGWALWHWPAFLYRAGYVGMGLPGIAGWLVSLLTGAILLTWLFNASRGSILAVAIFHATIDVAFTSDLASSLVVNLTGALVTFWGIGVVLLLGYKTLSRAPKQLWPPPTRVASPASGGT